DSASETSFDDFYRELEAEASARGPQGLQEFHAIEEFYRLVNSVRERRKKARLTQEALASLSGVRQGEISRIESGKGNPTLRTFAKLLGAIDAALEGPTARRA